jgi:hypothetical protein
MFAIFGRTSPLGQPHRRHPALRGPMAKASMGRRGPRFVDRYLRRGGDL